jgi:hypothetical protein
VNVVDIAGETIPALTTGKGGCIAQFVAGYTSAGTTIVNATETPQQGYTFSYWMLNGVPVTTSSVTLTMNQTHTVQAVFQANTEATPRPAPSFLGQYLLAIVVANILVAVLIVFLIWRRRQPNITILN